MTLRLEQSVKYVSIVHIDMLRKAWKSLYMRAAILAFVCATF